MLGAKMIAIPILLVCLAVTTGHGIEDNDRLPAGDWSVGFHLYQAEGFDSIPVRVISVTSKGNQGLTNVTVSNRSSKPVTAVKFGWYLSTEDGPGTILARGETPVLGFPNTLQADDTLRLSVPAVSLAKILKPIARGNTLRGDYSVQVVVTEIVYEDGSSWKFSQPNNVARVQIDYAHAMSGCANQTCRWHSEIGAYRCEDGAGELCTNQGQSCDSSACPPGGN